MLFMSVVHNVDLVVNQILNYFLFKHTQRMCWEGLSEPLVQWSCFIDEDSAAKGVCLIKATAFMSNGLATRIRILIFLTARYLLYIKKFLYI